MKLGLMFRDVVGALFKAPATQAYPYVRTPTPERLRGKLEWNTEKCTGCGLCVKDCPADAIELVLNDKPNKRFVMRYSLDRCIFCAQCVQNCRLNCLAMSNTDWELAALDKNPFLMYWGKEEALKAYLESREAPVEGQAVEVESNAG